MYAEIAAGARIRRSYETFNGDVQSNGDVSFTFQTVLIGVDVGDRWFMSTSFGYGTAWSPLMLGTGFKF